MSAPPTLDQSLPLAPLVLKSTQKPFVPPIEKSIISARDRDLYRISKTQPRKNESSRQTRDGKTKSRLLEEALRLQGSSALVRAPELQYEFNPLSQTDDKQLSQPASTEAPSYSQQHYAPLESVLDPLYASPRFSDSRIDVEALQRIKDTTLGVLWRSPLYKSTLSRSRLAFLSDLHFSLLFQDALEGNADGSEITLSAKAELYSMVNDRLKHPDPAVQIADETIVGTMNLMFFELALGQLATGLIHLQGLLRLFKQKWGPFRVGFDQQMNQGVIVYVVRVQSIDHVRC